MQWMVRCLMGAEHLPAFLEGMRSLVTGMTVWETRDESPDVHQVVSYRGVGYSVGSASVNVEIVSDEGWVDDIIRRIGDANAGDEFSVRRVSIMPIEASYHIRNGFLDI